MGFGVSRQRMMRSAKKKTGVKIGTAVKITRKQPPVDDVNSVGRNYNRSRGVKLGPATKITRKAGKTKTRTR